jgi:peptidoglycan/xylan/chitin deacetylase (PgdA/CDA1 family)
MSEILIFLAIAVFALFLVLGIVSHFKSIGRKWIYFTLSGLSLIAVALLLFSFNNSLDVDGKDPPKEPPTTETPAPDKNDDRPDEEVPPEEEKPVDEKPAEEKPDPPKPSEPQKITVPENGSLDYTVVKGDTLYSIATRAGVTVDKIKLWNGLKSDTIYVGQILRLYGKNAEPPPPKEPPKEEKPPTTASSVIITSGSQQKREIAFTFDAGSDAVGIQILDVLKKHNIKSTFFLTGKWVEKFPEYAKRIAADGHEIGNHSYSHPDAVKTTAAAFKQDIIKAEQIIKNITGLSPRPYFRFPYGSYNATALKTVGEAGYLYSIQWSLDTIDWRQPTTEELIARIESGASNGDIILMHIGGINTPSAVDQIIPKLKAMGYELVTLSELLN